jgi:hypothetical protein
MDCGKVIYGETCPYCEETAWGADGSHAAHNKAGMSRELVENSPATMAGV